MLLNLAIMAHFGGHAQPYAQWRWWRGSTWSKFMSTWHVPRMSTEIQIPVQPLPHSHSTRVAFRANSLQQPRWNKTLGCSSSSLSTPSIWAARVVFLSANLILTPLTTVWRLVAPWKKVQNSISALHAPFACTGPASTLLPTPPPQDI